MSIFFLEKLWKIHETVREMIRVGNESTMERPNNFLLEQDFMAKGDLFVNQAAEFISGVDKGNISPRLFPNLKKSMEVALQKVEIAYKKRDIEANQYEYAVKRMVPLYTFLEILVEKYKTEERQWGRLSLVRKDFLQYNGSEVLLHKDESTILAVATRILEFLGLAEGTKDHFCLEENSEANISAPEETPREKSKKTDQSLTK